ncbi:MAG: AEC family transporter [Clostridiales bacterium]|nr:AEC family transporter [Clostridiales bacterium]
MYGQFSVIFALMLTGYFLRKVNVTSDEMNRGLNKFIVNFSFPCFIFHKVAELEVDSGFFREFLLAFVLSSALFLAFGLYASAYTKLRHFPKEEACSAEPMMVFPNNAFMGFPIAYIFFGDTGLLFMLANNIAMNLTLFSWGAYALRRGDGKKLSLRSLARTLLNPNILALAAGLLFYAFEIPLPGAAGTYLSYIGGVCTPMAMIFIGSTLVGTNILEVVKDRLVLEPAINKTIVLPVLAFFALAFAPLPLMMKRIVVFGNCFPSAAVASVLVETEGKNSALACKILVVSTAVSVASIPAFAKLINLLVL